MGKLFLVGQARAGAKGETRLHELKLTCALCLIVLTTALN